MTFNPKSLLQRLAEWLVRRAQRRKPDFLIGGSENPYLRRWWMLPRNPIFNVYVHQILRPDDDRALHDHPWFWASYIVSGAYAEHSIRQGGVQDVACFQAGSLRMHSPWFAHRLVPMTAEVWTVFVTLPTIRVWGFHCPQRWVPWQQFVDSRDKGQVGRGCE